MSNEALNYPKIPIKPLKVDFPQIFHSKHYEHLNNLKLSLQEAQELETVTINQSESNLWIKYRKFRLTASNFGRVCDRRSSPSVSFLKSIFNASSLDHVQSVSYGKKHEGIARKNMFLK